MECVVPLPTLLLRPGSHDGIENGGERVAQGAVSHDRPRAL